MAGRKSIPEKTKEARGTNQPCRTNQNKPDFDVLNELPKPSSTLNLHGKKIYKHVGGQLMIQGILNPVNIYLFVGFCYEIGIYYQMLKELKKEELIIEEQTKYGKKKMINPKRKLANDSFDRAQKIGIEFGITPASENKVNAKKKNPDSLISQYL